MLMPEAVNQSADIRREERVETEFCAWYIPEGNSIAQKVKVRDLSQHGVKLEFPNWPDRSRRFHLALTLPGELKSARIECEWRWQLNQTIGAQFRQPLPFELLGKITDSCDGSATCLGNPPDNQGRPF